MIRTWLLFFLFVVVLGFVSVVVWRYRVHIGRNVRRNLTIARLLLRMNRVMVDPVFVKGVQPERELVDMERVAVFDRDDGQRENEYFSRTTHDRRLADCLNEVLLEGKPVFGYSDGWSNCVTTRTRTLPDD